MKPINAETPRRRDAEAQRKFKKRGSKLFSCSGQVFSLRLSVEWFCIGDFFKDFSCESHYLSLA
jgi:hypothetical protein